MVNRLFFITFFLANTAFGELTTAPSDVSFRMEFSKPEIFVGEQVLCSFNVYTPNELIEVEVAKFPEFRGFWNENLMLRQGPISTMFGMNNQPNSGTVGTYVLVPMLGQNHPTIEPMKIVLRTPASRRVEGSTPPDFILSQSMPLKVKPLPAVPTALSATKFFGAVGHFSITTAPGAVSFQAGEPTTLSFQLNGQGNFQDLNELPIEWPHHVSVVNSRTYIHGGAQVASKTFEYSIVTKDNRDFSVPAGEFLYFDPETATYEKLLVPEVRLAASQLKGSVSNGNDEPLPNLELRETWTATQSPGNFSWLFWMNLVFFAVVGLGVVMKLLRKPPPVPAAEEVELAHAYGRVEQELSKKDARAFLAAMESYIFFWIAFRLGIRAGYKSRRELLKLGQGKLSESQLQLAARVNEISTKLLYSPGTPALPSLSELRDSLDNDFPPPRLRAPGKAASIPMAAQ